MCHAILERIKTVDLVNSRLNSFHWKLAEISANLRRFEWKLLIATTYLILSKISAATQVTSGYLIV